MTQKRHSHALEPEIVPRGGCRGPLKALGAMVWEELCNELDGWERGVTLQRDQEGRREQGLNLGHGWQSPPDGELL